MALPSIKGNPMADFIDDPSSNTRKIKFLGLRQWNPAEFFKLTARFRKTVLIFIDRLIIGHKESGVEAPNPIGRGDCPRNEIELLQWGNHAV